MNADIIINKTSKQTNKQNIYMIHLLRTPEPVPQPQVLSSQPLQPPALLLQAQHHLLFFCVR